MMSKPEATKAEHERRGIQTLFTIGLAILGSGTVISIFSTNLIAFIISGFGWLALAIAAYDRRSNE
jgi:hypothetical protein